MVQFKANNRIVRFTVELPDPKAKGVYAGQALILASPPAVSH